MYDCNKCYYINMTEKMQNMIKDGKKLDHICTKYNKKVIHGANRIDHDPKLIPCDECQREHGFKKHIKDGTELCGGHLW